MFMIERNKTNIEQGLEQSSAEKALVDLWKKGIFTSECIAFHGTSLEAIQIMAHTGYIPGYTLNDDYESSELPQPGDVYFHPRDNTFPFDEVNIDEFTNLNPGHFKDTLTWSMSYAKSNAVAHNFCAQLGLDISQHELHAYDFHEDFYRPTSPDGIENRAYFRNLRIPEHLQSQTLITANRRKGVILGLHRNTLKHLPISLGDGGDDFRVSTGMKGLHYQFLSGLLALGPQENAFFASLERKHIKRYAGRTKT